jgi:hypothetical protein
MKKDLSKTIESLKIIIADTKAKKEKDIMENRIREEEQRKQRNEQDRIAIMSSVGKDLTAVLAPFLDNWAKDNKTTTDTTKTALDEISKGSNDVIDTLKTAIEELARSNQLTADSIKKVLDDLPKNNKLTVDDIKTAIADSVVVNIPKIEVPTVYVPDIKVPKPEVTVNFDTKSIVKGLKDVEDAVSKQNIPFADTINTTLKGVDFKHPLPVILTDNAGNPYIAGSIGGKSSGGAMVIKDKSGKLATISQLTNEIGVLNVGIFDSSGNQVDIFGGSAVISGSVEVKQVSGFVDSVIVNEIFGTTGADLINPDGRLKVEMPAGGSGLTDIELRASHLDVMQLSGSTDSVYVTGVVTSIYAEMMNPDGRVKVELPTGSSGLTDTELRASHLDVFQLSGAVDSVIVNGFLTSVGASILNGDGGSLDPRDRTWEGTEVLTTRQISGGVDSVIVNEIFGSVCANLINPDGRMRVEVSADEAGLTDTELRASTLDVKQVSGSVDSVIVNGFLSSVGATILNGEGLARNSWDTYVKDVIPGTAATNLGKAEDTLHTSGDVGVMMLGVRNEDGDDFSGTDKDYIPFALDAKGHLFTHLSPEEILVVRQLSGAEDSVIVNGFLTSVGATLLNGDGLERDTWNVNVIGSVDTVRTNGLTRQANPTAVASDYVPMALDDLGRQINRPIQIRDLITTAYASATTQAETDLIAGVASTYLDLIYIMGANSSGNAVNVAIRSGTAGAILMTLQIPANGTAGVSLPVPIPQTEVAQSWTFQNTGTDQSNTNIYVSALFSKEV